jgi:hypothetical protein
MINVLLPLIDEFANRTRGASNRAAAAGQRALDAQEKVGTILSKLPEDKNKVDRLANTVAKTDKSITDATSQGKTPIIDWGHCGEWIIKVRGQD